MSHLVRAKRYLFLVSLTSQIHVAENQSCSWKFCTWDCKFSVTRPRANGAMQAQIGHGWSVRFHFTPLSSPYAEVYWTISNICPKPTFPSRWIIVLSKLHFAPCSTIPPFTTFNYVQNLITNIANRKINLQNFLLKYIIN